MQLRLPVILILFFGLVFHAFADFQKGCNAYYKKDYTTALKEFKPLAEQGDLDSQFHLGRMYDDGEGIPEDKAEAVKWYQLAAEQGDFESQFYLGEMYATGKGVPKDDVLAYMWFNIASFQGDETAGPWTSDTAKTMKDVMALTMTSAEIAQAQELSKTTSTQIAQSLSKQGLKRNYDCKNYKLPLTTVLKETWNIILSLF